MADITRDAIVGETRIRPLGNSRYSVEFKDIPSGVNFGFGLQATSLEESILYIDEIEREVYLAIQEEAFRQGQSNQQKAINENFRKEREEVVKEVRTQLRADINKWYKDEESKKNELLGKLPAIP